MRRVTAKIMLFGEYGIIRDSMALTIPYRKFSGILSFIGDLENLARDRAEESNRHILGFLKYLENLQPGCGPDGEMDLESLQKDVASGLYFDSDIPQGYGAGSSGALVAALYDSYGTRKPFAPDDPDTTSFQGLKSCFGRMESYFHGTSSGLDPLICFVNRPILVRDRNTIAIAEIPGENFGPNRGVFLLDAGKPGKTGPLVKEFLERCNREDFLREFRERYVTAIDRCIGHLLEGDWQGMEKALSLLSAYQLDHMVDLIPEQMRKPWKTGLGDPRFKLKLCGSGGGGFILCFASDSQGTESYFRTLDTVLIPVPLNN